MDTPTTAPLHIYPGPAPEFPVLRLICEDQGGTLHRMTLLSTREVAPGLENPAAAAHLSSLAQLAGLRIVRAHRLSALHLEMRSHPGIG